MKPYAASSLMACARESSASPRAATAVLIWLAVVARAQRGAGGGQAGNVRRQKYGSLVIRLTMLVMAACASLR